MMTDLADLPCPEFSAACRMDGRDQPPAVPSAVRVPMFSSPRREMPSQKAEPEAAGPSSLSIGAGFRVAGEEVGRRAVTWGERGTEHTDCSGGMQQRKSAIGWELYSGGRVGRISTAVAGQRERLMRGWQ